MRRGFDKSNPYKTISLGFETASVCLPSFPILTKLSQTPFDLLPCLLGAFLVSSGVNPEILWRKGENENEQGIDRVSRKVLIEIDPNYYRPTEVDILIGSPEKAKRELGWQPRTNFHELVKIMVQADVEKVRKRGY